MYGRPAEIGEDLAAFSYPLYALFLFWPLCFIHSYPLVQAMWMTLMLHALLAGIVLTARVARWGPPAWLRGVTLILGQMAAAVFLATLQSSRETSTVYLPFPVLMLVVQVPG
jgi:hypothetical protein